MAIVNPDAMNFDGQKFTALIYGSPGTGKTTLALSAPKPILIDFDHGVSRVRASHRMPTIFCKNYEEVQKDLRDPAIAQFETLIIDTGGSFVAYLKDWAFRKGAKFKNGEFDGRRGFGMIKAEFESFTNQVKNVLGMNLIFVFHSEEKADRDGNMVQRLVCEGSCKNIVWNGVDFGGYVQMIGTTRTICFSPEQEYFAKSTHGITGRMAIPELDDGTPNDFLTRLFDQARQNIAAEAEVYAPKREAYNRAMEQGKAIIDSIVDADSANAAMKPFKEIQHALTSEKELSPMFTGKVKAMGLTWDKASKQYVQQEGK